MSISSVFALRVWALVESSVSHQPLCSASPVISDIIRWISSSISDFTLARGSVPARTASAASCVLCSRCETSRRKLAARDAASLGRSLPRSCTRALAPLTTLATFAIAAAGRCLAAAPFTSSPSRISTAFSSAEISSPRRFSRAWNSADFVTQVRLRSVRYLESSLRSATTPVSSPLAAADSCLFFASAVAFRERAASAASEEALRS
mmetsp:Transcript_5830/g.15716  ORF Transcript_5830/g.15716 Transcript_5830/m.15716 type:complete len:207 (-) Transcript_5830:894-1514(-)